MFYNTEAKQSLVARYHAGESVAAICADTGVPRSTFYTWTKPYMVTATNSGHAVSQQEFIKLKQKLRKLEETFYVFRRFCDVFPLFIRKSCIAAVVRYII